MVASGPSASGATARTFAFVDLAGFTALTEAHGDEAAVDVVGVFFERARSAVAGRGELVKTLGDAVMLAFDSPTDGLVAVGELLEASVADSTLPAPRAGLNHGSAIRQDDDWFGATVNLTARIASQASGGETLATAGVASAARGLGLPTVDLGCFELRNILEPVELFQIELIPPVEAISIDPVCRMQISHTSAAGRLRQGDVDLWFCSLPCVKAFLNEPSRYPPESA